MTKEPPTTDWLDAIRARFMQTLAERHVELDALADSLDRSESQKQAAFILHRIAGVAGTVGHAALGQEAKAIEDVLTEVTTTGRNMSAAETHRYEDFLDQSQEVLLAHAGR